MATRSHRKSLIRRAVASLDTRRLGPPVVSGFLDITYEQTSGAPRD